MKIKEQTRKLAAGCSKHCFEVVDETDEVSNIHTSTSPCRTQVQPAASFLVCSLIFIEYNNSKLIVMGLF